MENLIFDCGTDRVRADATVEQCRRLYPDARVRLTATFDDPPQYRVLVRGAQEPRELRPVRYSRAG